MDSFKVTAPVRADLAGGTLDLWPLYCLVNGGKTINVALDIKASASFEVLPSVAFKVEVKSPTSEVFAFEEPLSFEDAAKLSPSLRFPVAVVSQYLRQQSFLPEKFLKISLETEAPVGSGLGGSSTLCIAMVRGLSRLFSDFVELGWQWKMLAWSRDVEACYLKTATGTQDYLSAMFGGLACLNSQVGKVDRTPYSDAAFEGLSERLVVLFSGEMHHSGMSNWELFKKALDGDGEVLKGLKSIADVAEVLDEQLRAPEIQWKRVGKCLTEEWEVRSQTFRVATPRLKEITQFLQGQGVLGAKVCGAAQGGSLIALVEPERKAALQKVCMEKGIQVLQTRPTREGVVVLDPKKNRPAVK